ncbi:type 1 phosphatases regulator YPI1 [Zopfochytrium polystomum]|nr:type 1 phosphatases regulator YPI1 [Zopfochytrium polystomum]
MAFSQGTSSSGGAAAPTHDALHPPHQNPQHHPQLRTATAPSSSASASRTITLTETRTEAATATVRLTAVASTPLQDAASSGRRIQWAENVEDNEGLGRKSSKVCCIYRKPRRFDESSDESSDSSDSGSDSDGPNAYEKQPSYGRKSKGKDRKGHRRHDHDHSHDHTHDHDHGHSHGSPAAGSH